MRSAKSKARLTRKSSRRRTQTQTQTLSLQPPSNSPPSSDSVAASRDLWDEAYEALCAENPELIQKYEQIIIEHGKQKTGSIEPNLAGNHSIPLRENFEKGVKIVLSIKDFLSSVVSSEPYGAMVWAGVCIFLPLLENPMRQNTDAHDCLESVPFTVRRLRVMERLIRPELSGLPQDTYHEDSLALIRDFEEAIVKLYTAILEFQIRLGRQYSERWGVRYGRDILKADDWAGLKSKMNDLEAKCTTLARDISLEKIEAALHSSDSAIQTGFEQIQKGLEKTAAGIERQTLLQSSWRQTDEEREIIQLLRKENLYENQKKRVPKRVSETCKWVFENKKFLDWSTSKGADLLWLSAKPGSGKSVVAKTLVEEQLISSTPPFSAICYFFFKDISTYQRNPLSAMAAILHQLFSAFPSLVKYALSAYEMNGEELVNLLDTMFDILQDAAADPAVGQIVCVLDALDECDQNERAFLIQRINAFYHECKDSPQVRPKLKFFLTSRPYDDIQSQFHHLTKEMPTIHLSGDEESGEISEEIDQVTTTKVQDLAAEKGFDQDTTEFLLQKLLQVKNRTYLWLSLILEEIRLSHRRGNRREIEKLVSELPQSVIDTYDSILNKSRDKKLARELLNIILGAKVPLSLRDMSVATALAGDLSYTSYEEIGLESLDVLEMRLRNICGLFVVIDDGYVFLIHQSAKDYLLAKAYNEGCGDWRHSFHPPEYENLLTSVCICLLSFKCFSSDPLPKEEEHDSDSSSGDDQGDNLSVASNDDLNLAESYNDSHPLFEYAAKYWTEHCRLCKHESQQEWLPRITAVCDARSTTFKRWFAIYRRIDGGHLPQKTTSLNVAAHLKFLNVLQYFLDQGEDPNERDGHGAVPLQSVTQESFKATKLLVDAGSDVNADGWEAPYVKPIDEEDGRVRIVRKLSGPPLYMAIHGGNFEAVKHLVQNGASVDIQRAESHRCF